MGGLHDLAYHLDILVRYGTLEEVAHRIHEDSTMLGPAQRFVELRRYQAEVESLLVRMTMHPPESLGKSLGVAMLAARANLHASPHRVPSGIGPLNLRVVAHLF